MYRISPIQRPHYLQVVTYQVINVHNTNAKHEFLSTYHITSPFILCFLLSVHYTQTEE